MIYESYPWRIGLKRIRNEFIETNTEENFKLNDDRTYSILEQDIFLSAFIIRKLIDCRSKVTDELRNYSFKVRAHKSIKKVTFFKRWPEDGCYDLENYERSSKRKINL